jgi:hypothetical protein
LTQVSAFLKRSPGQPGALAISLLELDILTFYLRDLFEFLYYLRQRVRLYEYFLANDEASLLAFHLKKKLWPSPGMDGEYIDSDMAQLIDANFQALRGDHPMTAGASKLHHTWKNASFDALVSQIKTASNPGFVDAVFFLYDVSGVAGDALMKGINDTKDRVASDRKTHTFALRFGNGAGATYVCRADNPGLLPDHVFAYALAKKHSERAEEWIGLGSMVSSPNMVDVAVYNNQPWVDDDELEQLGRDLLNPGIAINPNRKLGRNDPCYCGSGRKFKKCHGGNQ